ncbi:50S ribosomal protein L22 [Armatimonas rosea]|jgi:large subunit ribosomal protein L22|uniref:Large ribosomal subunit protein uL22 n=1 Tax=Armatimonas rosea TaxID=685828 RepID=A0A7W9SS33_ARMRO|nr:large subunit ribosomal protein L22 [Armatimonas rosea]
MESQATARFVRMAPRKVRLVLDSVRGKYAQEALDQLKFTPNHAAAEIAKVVTSACANAVNNFEMNPDYLKIVRCYVDVGPTMKRVKPRAQGRAYRILKRTSHITVVVAEGEAPPRKTGRKTEKKPPLRAALPTPVEAVKAEEVVAPVEATETTETTEAGE